MKTDQATETSEATSSQRTHELWRAHRAEPDNAGARAALLGRLRQVCGELNQPERLVLILHYHEGLSIDEVAEVLTLTASEVLRIQAAIFERLDVPAPKPKVGMAKAECGAEESALPASALLLPHSAFNIPHLL
jgi:DNA-directed RNA polymerase specialized sigma24 family protein